MPITAEELRERAKAWVQPISAETPAGAAATTDPRYEFVRTEAAKLDSPTNAGNIQWKSVVDQGGELLQQKSKDFLVGSYVAYGLYITGGVKGLTDGLMLLSELSDQYWPTMFPELKRIRGRVNALGWFVERVTILLPNVKVAASDRANLEALSVAAKHFSQVSRAKFENNTPAMGPLLENVERLLMSLPAEAPPPPPPQAAPPPAAAPPPVAAATPAPTQEVAASAPAESSSGGASPLAGVSAAPAELANPGDTANYLRGVGTSLVAAANLMRRSDAMDATAYRMMRAGIWLPVANAPPAQGNKTMIPPVAAQLRTQFEKMALGQKWPELLEQVESAMGLQRYWLDLQRYSFQSMNALGSGYNKAKDVLLSELSSLLRRMPTLADLSYSDGGAFADAQTKLWIESDVATHGGGSGGGSKSGGAVDESAAAITEARGMMGKGQANEAIALLQGKIATANGASSRFRVRMALAKLCIQGAQLPIAKAIYEGLERDVTAHGLEQWDPALAAEVLEGLVICFRGIAKGGKALPPEAPMMYDRLCRIDPAAAAKIGA